jgi:hypothetical protein
LHDGEALASTELAIMTISYMLHSFPPLLEIFDEKDNLRQRIVKKDHP